MEHKTFTFTRVSPLRTVLLDIHDHPVYKVETPFKWVRPTTTISRYSGSYEQEMARIHWRFARPSLLVFGGRVFESNTFLKKVGLLGISRKFQAPDGHEYKWVATPRWGMKLISNDGSRTLVARLFEGSTFTSKRKSRLEIFPAGIHMMDLIVVTLVYVDKIRRDRQQKPNTPLVL
ncbi:hypothetical protein JAAARDRAFT_32149 [Jaapia argillacea MUCL 33604]|uniref:DUF6593 domain-containing protein n=1 Tax=Jaapia argillacea MUCL 33604 TaxID=933084 RepID=A0A067Q4P9_9AGAM|nr:hypothetical protein JAAARDRAFT_32149 [Jaapia argillacea MUCL 33604]